MAAVGLAAAMLACGSAVPQPSSSQVPEVVATPVPLPGGTGGIGFDDLGFAPELDRILAPAGRTGNLDLVNPATSEVVSFSGFSAQESHGSGHGEGTTSAAFGRGLLFAIDRTTRSLHVLDPADGKFLATVELAGSPDYVRWVEPRDELWVTQPDSEQIEVFALPSSDPPTPVHTGRVVVPGGPESLVIDAERGRAYTHLWRGTTLAIDLERREIVARWSNDCRGSRGIALDPEGGLLFVGCAEGRVVALDVDHDGAIRDSLAAGDGIDIIAFNGSLRHLYAPGGRSRTMAVVGVSAAGRLSLLGTVDVAAGSHCVAADDRGQAWVCDPSEGRLLRIADEWPATR